MPWMFINILDVIDQQMKSSIHRQIENKKLKNLPKKAFYNYLIIDENKLNNYKTKNKNYSLIPNEPTIKDFVAFKNAIFYVGKGISNRKHQHLTLAKQLYCGVLPLKKVQLKVAKIASLWSKNNGVSLIQLDCDATSYEAFSRENCIINSLNFNSLTNRIQGTSYGGVKTWPYIKVVNYGDMLLYQMFRNYLAKKPNVIFANDVILKPSIARPRFCTSCKILIK